MLGPSKAQTLSPSGDASEFAMLAALPPVNINTSNHIPQIMSSGNSYKPSTSFTTKRINRTTFVVREDDLWEEHPLIYVKLHPLVPLVILSDTGCDEPSKKHQHGMYHQFPNSVQIGGSCCRVKHSVLRSLASDPVTYLPSNSTFHKQKFALALAFVPRTNDRSEIPGS